MLIYGYMQFKVRFGGKILFVFTISKVEKSLFEEIMIYFSQNKDGDETRTYSDLNDKIFSQLPSNHDGDTQFIKLSELKILSDQQLNVLKDIYTFSEDEFNSIEGYNLFNVTDTYIIYQKTEKLLVELSNNYQISQIILDSYYDTLSELYFGSDKEKLIELYQFILEWKNSLDYENQIIKNLPLELSENETYDQKALEIISEYAQYNYHLPISENNLPKDFIKKYGEIIYIFFTFNFLDLHTITLKDLENYNSPVFDDIIKYMKSKNLDIAYLF